MLNIYEVCERLGISIFTLKKWYTWENKRLESGEVTERYLPVPEKAVNQRGCPNMWTEEMVEQLRKHKEGVVVGRNGIYGKFTNPEHKNTKKYKAEMEGKNE